MKSLDYTARNIRFLEKVDEATLEIVLALVDSILDLESD